VEQLTSFTLNTLLNDVLGYDTRSSTTNYRDVNYQFESDVAHLYRTARRIKGFRGVYIFKTSSDKQVSLPERSAICFAEANTIEEARDIHQKIWNLGLSPFLVILLPSHVRVYTARDFDIKKDKFLLEESLNVDTDVLRKALFDFSAISVDSGIIWKSDKAKKIESNRKVDTRLLRNLARLAQILVDEYTLEQKTAHALIGKYVYLKYLNDRRILSEEWLKEQNIEQDKIFGRQATKEEFVKLSNVLDKQFNGNIFPFELNHLNDEQVNLVASVFEGDEPASAKNIQSRLDFEDFKAYNFEYIPTETLSFIYELFLKAQNRNSQTGAYYTPEWLADYVLSEVNSFKPLKRGMKILDPSCGSGVFLVLAYQRLIEEELQNRLLNNLSPEELSDILSKSIYGVEIEPDACRVAELSLILTLLNYVEPPELHKNKEFRFPRLSNNNIFNNDFFDDESKFWVDSMKFDWIIGNPPWKKLEEKDEQTNPNVFEWIGKNKNKKPVSQMKIEEAFSWRVAEKLHDQGVIGIVHHATSLFNVANTTQKYRKAFFKEFEVLRVTNFANFRQFLFKGIQIPSQKGKKNPTSPAATLVYRLYSSDEPKKYITHYGPFADTQIQNASDDLWSITINEQEITTISPDEAELGLFQTWKFALWGSQRDRQAISYLKKLFNQDLLAYCKSKFWTGPAEGSQLRDIRELPESRHFELHKIDWLEGMKILNSDALENEKKLLSIPENALERIDSSNAYLRVRGGNQGLNLTLAPHIFISSHWGHIIYSDIDFVMPPRQIGIATSMQPDEDEIYMKALAIYLNSSLVTYFVFFNSPEWGTYRVGSRKVVLKEIKKIPVPRFTSEQAQSLAKFHDELLDREKNQPFLSSEIYGEAYHKTWDELDIKINQILNIPNKMLMIARDFINTRLPLDEGLESRQTVTRSPNEKLLFEYAKTFRDELDGFSGGKRQHLVTISQAPNFTECLVEIKPSKVPHEPIIKTARGNELEAFTKLRDSLRTQHSQKVYVQRSLRVFDGPSVYIYKPSRIIDWTRTQALNDATDLIGEILESEEEPRQDDLKEVVA
jgi:type I restriction-modification system DNA methylase subunit